METDDPIESLDRFTRLDKCAQMHQLNRMLIE